MKTFSNYYDLIEAISSDYKTTGIKELYYIEPNTELSNRVINNDNMWSTVYKSGIEKGLIKVALPVVLKQGEIRLYNPHIVTLSTSIISVECIICSPHTIKFNKRITNFD